MKIKCSVCKKEFNRRPSEILKRKYSYCSRQCYAKHKRILQQGKNNTFFGKKHSEETKKKIGNSNRGKRSVKK